MATKKARWHKGTVEWQDPDEPDTINISVVFTWDAAKAYSRTVWLRNLGYKVRVGGPGIFTLHRDFRDIAEIGDPIPDTVVRHNPSATFASRGCSVGCYFCIVPAMEGRAFTLLPDFEPRPILCDNNLSALPSEYQDHIVEKYRKSNVPLLDANSGFEPATFDEQVYQRWKVINQGPWRYAYDETAEGPEVERVCHMLSDLSPRMKRVYVLIGNEPFEDCMARIRSTIDWGAEPHCQPIIRLNARAKRPWVRYDWTPKLLRDVTRWVNGWAYRRCDFSEYSPSLKSGRPSSRRRGRTPVEVRTN